MPLHYILNVLLIVVCAHAQLQQPFHAADNNPEVSNITPRPLYEDVASHGSGGNQPNMQDGQNHPHRRDSSLDMPGSSEVNNVQSHFPLFSFKTSNQLSTDSKSDKLKSLYSSVRNVLRANSLFGKWKNRDQHVSSLSEESAPVNPSVSAGGSPQNSEYYFFEGSVAGTQGKSNELTPSPSAVQAVAKNTDSDNVHTPSPSDQEPVTLSSMLKDTFLERNPTMMPGYFEKNTEVADVVQHVAEPDDELSSYEQQPSSLVNKRDKEIVPGDSMTPNDPGSSQQNAHNDTALAVQERSWRCSIPDVLVGDGELPWTCRQRWAWRFLGEHVYPSRLYEAVCEGRTCWYGHFNCTPITYTLHVLEVCLHGCHDQRVPFPLRSLWQWTDLNVTVGCQCVR